MNFFRYLSDKKESLFIDAILLIAVWGVLSVLNVNIEGIIFLCGICVTGRFIAFLIEYLKKKNFYDKVYEALSNLDKKYFLSETIEKPDFFEGKLFYDSIRYANKSMNDEIAKYAIMSKEYREYIELWIHEVKTPVASSRLIAENNKNEITDSIAQELDVIDGYLEQVLFYSRSNNVEKDYILKMVSLRDIVYDTLRDNAKEFIRHKTVHKEESMDMDVYTDKKWIKFVLKQIINNAMKYSDDSKEVHEITFTGEEKENSIILRIRDNGIGINQKDIQKVFEKGFTGTTGRKYSKSTGIGLYLAKKLCIKMGLGISIESEEGIFTCVSIIFSKSEYILSMQDNS